MVVIEMRKDLPKSKDGRSSMSMKKKKKRCRSLSSSKFLTKVLLLLFSLTSIVQIWTGQQYLLHLEESDIKLDRNAAELTSMQPDERSGTAKERTDLIKDGKLIESATAMKVSSRALPKFQKGKGGLVIFYHVAKTGGSTIRSLFEKLYRQDPSNFRKRRYLNVQQRDVEANDEKSFGNSCIPPGKYKNKMDKAYHEILDLITGESERHHDFTILWEIHGGSPGLDIIMPYIQQLRKASGAHNKSFFAFTLVREPLSYTKSYFKYFHVDCASDWCEHDQYESNSEENFLASAQSHPNQQCFLLKHSSSIAGLHPSFYNKCKVTEDDCNMVYRSMKSTFDWIGTTAKLSLDTLPLLYYVLGCNGGKDPDEESDHFTVTNEKVAKTLPFEKSIRTATTTMLSSVVSFDQAIYDQVTSDYVLADLFPEIAYVAVGP